MWTAQNLLTRIERLALLVISLLLLCTLSFKSGPKTGARKRSSALFDAGTQVQYVTGQRGVEEALLDLTNCNEVALDLVSCVSLLVFMISLESNCMSMVGVRSESTCIRYNPLPHANQGQIHLSLRSASRKHESQCCLQGDIGESGY